MFLWKIDKNLLMDKNQKYIKKNFTNSLKFRFILFKILPMGFLSGMRIKELNEEKCSVTVPYKWLNKNPFKSIFWAVLGMAAEMSAGALVILFTHGKKPSISLLVAKCEAEFIKKATSKITFICNDGDLINNAINEAIETKEAVQIETYMEGIDSDGDIVAKFKFIWSLKQRSN